MDRLVPVLGENLGMCAHNCTSPDAVSGFPLKLTAVACFKRRTGDASVS